MRFDALFLPIIFGERAEVASSGPRLETGMTRGSRSIWRGPVDVVGIGFHSREMGDGSSIINTFTVTVDDGETLGPFPARPGLAIVDVTFSGQTLRFDAVDTTSGNTGAVEIEIYR